MAQNPLDDVTAAVKDAAFVTVGLGVIAFQRLMIRRQELTHAISTQAEEARGAVDVVTALVGERIKAVEERVGATFDRGKQPGSAVASYDPAVMQPGRIQRVRAVVLCWNNVAFLDRCLEHLGATDWPGDLEVVVVDNGSTDGSVDRWEERHPRVRLIQTGTNLGYAGGVNRGLTQLDDLDAVALVNSDAFVDPGWLRPLAAALEADSRVGAASPKILLAGSDGGPPRINNAGNVLGPTFELHDRGLGEVDDGQYDAEEDVWGWCGAAVLLRRRYLDDVGRFDERLFLYAEDADLSWRGAKRGWRYRYVPTAVVHHQHRASSGGERTPLLDHLNRRNRLVVVTRHGGVRGAAVAWSRALGGIVVAVGTDLVAPVLRGRRPDAAPIRRRVRAAVDAARLLAGGHPPLS